MVQPLMTGFYVAQVNYFITPKEICVKRPGQHSSHHMQPGNQLCAAGWPEIAKKRTERLCGLMSSIIL